MINQEVVDQHAEEAAFLWTQRDHATGAPQYALKDLAKLDERVEAHVDGLRVAADAGWKTALLQLDQGVGGVFAASVLAFESGDPERVSAVLQVGCSAPRLGRGLASALGWIQQDTAATQSRKLLASQEPEVRRTGIAGMAVHRVDPGPLLDAALADESPRVAARAIRAAAELGRTNLLPKILERLSDVDEECRFWSAWSALRLGERRASDAIAVLLAAAESDGPFATLAVEQALRVMTVRGGNALRLQLAEKPATARLGVICAGVIGDPAAVWWLIEQMEIPELARVAGAAFSMITGADLGYEDLDGDAPVSPLDDGDDDVATSDLDSDFRWPQATAVAKWWAKRASNFVPGVRYILGKPIAEQSLLEALINGKQNQRAAAALELSLLHPSQILFETRERAQRQLTKIKQWNS